MAAENHDEIAAQMLLSLQGTESSSTLLPTSGTRANDNFDRFSNPEPDVNLQLSLGGFYVKTPNSALTHVPTSSAHPANSSLKRSYLGQNRFLQDEAAEIKINKEIQVITKPKNQEGGSAETSGIKKSNEVNTLVSPLDNPIWAAQSAFGNPAFQRAMNVIKSNGIPSTPINTNLTNYASRNPHAVRGMRSQHSIVHPTFNNGNSTGTHINNGTNQRFLVTRKQPENLNLVAPVNFRHACGNFINHQLQALKHVPPPNCSLATMDQPSHWSIDGNIMMHSLPVPFVPSSSGHANHASFPFPVPFGSRGHNIPIVPQNAIAYTRPHFTPNFFPNGKVPSFLPISSNTNANSFNPCMHHQLSQSFARPAGIRPITLPEVINGLRAQQSPINQANYPCKRARLDNFEVDQGVELQQMKQLPLVVTTGGSPNGKKIEGILYKYGTDQEVTIICVCHGCFFTAEEFVRHAGRGDVENPRQQISLLDYP